MLQLRGAQREVKIQSHTAAGLEHIMPPPFVLDASKQVPRPGSMTRRSPALLLCCNKLVELAPDDLVMA